MLQQSLILLLLFSLLLCPTPTFSRVGRINLTPSGPSVSRIAYGTLHLSEASGPAQVLTLIETALSLGITTFDLSDVYGGAEVNMKLFGAALALKPSLRSQMELVAKMDVIPGAGYDTSTAHLQRVMDDYLSALQTTYVDIVLLHRQDYLMDAGEVSALFWSWLSSGKVRYVGTSNYDCDAFLNLGSRVPLVTNEVEVSVWAPETLCPRGYGPVSGDSYYTNDGLVDFHYRLNMSVLAWGPLGGDPYGGANRLFKRDGTRQTQIRTALQIVGQHLGDEEDVVALAWLMRHPANIVPIIGTMRTDRMTNQTRAEALAPNMSRADWYAIAKAIGIPLP